MAKLSAIKRLRPFQFLLLALLVFASHAEAAPLRVATWNLEPNILTGTNGQSPKFQRDLIEEAAETLKKSRPDVILLQQVKDWETCYEMVRALKPASYSVALCSSFHAPGEKKLLPRQIAILAKNKPYFTWSEPWRIENGVSLAGGYAFATIKIGETNIGFFSVEMGDDSRPALNSESQNRVLSQIAQQVITAQGWQANRPETFIVAGDLTASAEAMNSSPEKSLSTLSGLEFNNALASLSQSKRLNPPGAINFILASGAYASTPKATQTALINHSAVICDFNPGSAPVVATAPTPSIESKAPHAAAAVPVAPPLAINSPTLAATNIVPPNKQFIVWLTLGLGVIAITLVLWLVTKRRLTKTEVLLPVTSPLNETGTMDFASLPESTRDNVASNLSRWLKQKFVRKLISDRAQLMATQQIAALKMLAVDERLAKIEKQIEERNREYEQRISELVAELETAREENRELIQAKIDLIKAEMAKQPLKGTRFSKPHQQN